MQTTNDLVLVNGSQLIQFHEQVDDATRQDILHASLLAQLAADKFIQSHPLPQWHGTYAQTLRKLDILETQTQSWPLRPAAGESRTILQMFTDLAPRFDWLAPLTTLLARLLSAQQAPDALADEVLRASMVKHGSAVPPSIELELCSVFSRSQVRRISVSVPALPCADASLHPLAYLCTRAQLKTPITVRSSVSAVLDSYARHRAAVIAKLGDAPARLSVALRAAGT